MLLNKILYHGDKVIINNKSKNIKSTVCTLLGYAAQNQLNPSEFYNKAKEINEEINNCQFGHYRQSEIRKFVWLETDNPGFIPNRLNDKIDRIQLKVGDAIIIDDEKYIITPGPNNTFEFINI